MIYKIPHTSSALQTQNFVHMGKSLTLTTRWNTVMQFWNIDVYDNIEQKWLTQSEALSLGSASLYHLDLPFVFVMLDDSEYGSLKVSQEAMSDTLNVYIVNKGDYDASVQKSLSINYRK